jgi:hypothetical protein
MWETNVIKWKMELLERGIQKGIALTRSEITSKLIKSGMSDEEIKKTTGIAVEKVVYIRRKSK